MQAASGRHANAGGCAVRLVRGEFPVALSAHPPSDEFAPTSEQRAVIEYRGGHMLVFAGPGTGKTETLARRFASLAVDDGVEPSDILVLTFSRSAAEAMRERILKRLRERQGAGLAVRELFVRTFHSFCRRLLDGDEPGVRQRRLLTPVKERLLWQRVIAGITLKTLSAAVVNSSAFAADALNYIARLKGEGCAPDDLLRAAAGDARAADIAALYRALEQQRSALGLSDFRDLVRDAVSALGDRNSAPSRWLRSRGAFRHILVDEFQDSDRMQLRLLQKLAGDGLKAAQPVPQMCLVGDFNQSIYRFRGASPDNILRAKDEFGCASFSLQLNRRSAQAVLDVANQTPGLRPESLTPAEDAAKPGAVRLRQAQMADDEVALVCDAVAQRIRAGTPANQIAVLLRVNQPYQSLISQELIARGLPVAARPNEGFHEDSLISAVLDALRLLEAPDDRVLQRRLLTNPLVGFTALSVSLGEPRGRLDYAYWQAAWLRLSALQGSARDAPTLMRAVARELDLLGPVRSGRQVPGFDPWASPARLKALLDAAADMYDTARALREPPATAKAFLARIEEIIGLIADPAEPGATAANGVRVMSIHAAKGLEFDFVIVPQCVEGVLPAAPRNSDRLLSAGSVKLAALQALDGKQALREEASLWYVALTRARHEVLATTTCVDDDGVEQVRSRFAAAINDAADGAVRRTLLPAEASGEERFSAQAPCAIMRQLESLSPTSINRFLICPRQFFYADVLRLPRTDSDETRAGNFMHAALERFHNEERDFRDASHVERSAQAYVAQLRALAAETARSRAADDGLAAGAPALKYQIERAWRQLERYVAWLVAHAREQPFVVLFNEQHVACELGGIRLNGKVDRIDRLSDGSIAIRDYKSGKLHGRGCAQTARELLRMVDEQVCPFGNASRGTNLQALLYVAGVEALTGARVGRIDYIYIGGKANSSGDAHETVADSVVLSDRPAPEAAADGSTMSRVEVDRVRAELAAGIVDICSSGRLSRFYTTANEAACEYCDHVKVCPGAGTIPP